MIKTFTAQPKDIKIAIERLMSKEYLKRDEVQRDNIKYVE